MPSTPAITTGMMFFITSCGAGAGVGRRAGRARGGGARGRRAGGRRRRRRRSRVRTSGFWVPICEMPIPALPVPHAEPMHEKTSAIAAPPKPSIGAPGGQRAMLSGAILAACGAAERAVGGASRGEGERRAPRGKLRRGRRPAGPPGSAAPRGARGARAAAVVVTARAGSRDHPPRPVPGWWGKRAGRARCAGAEGGGQRRQGVLRRRDRERFPISARRTSWPRCGARRRARAPR